MINESYFSGLIQKDGIYFSKGDVQISYPDEGNQGCYQLEDNSFWFRHRASCIIEAVKKFHIQNYFFDIGGGNGFVSKALTDVGVLTVLLEPGLSGCINAKERGLNNIICGTLESANFPEASIQSIGLFDVLEHIEEDHSFLTKVHFSLKQNGVLFLTVPAFKFLWSEEDDFAKHFRRYTLSELEEKLKKLGFSIKYSTYIFSVIPFPVFLFRTFPYLLGFKKRQLNMKQHSNDHRERNGILSRLLDKIWKFEVNYVKRGIKIPFGGSCFIVAEKH